MLFSEKWPKNDPKFLLHFLIHIDVLMLCKKFEPMLFSEKWPKNDPKFLLHFLIHIDVLMLCKKFELIPT